MHAKTLLPFSLLLMAVQAEAQSGKKNNKAVYAITSSSAGGSRWTEVNLIDGGTGEVITPVYQSKQEINKLHARTRKPIITEEQKASAATPAATGQTVTSTTTYQTPEGTRRTVVIRRNGFRKTDPFATSSAACAYDAKNKRLYYTPMSIAELRYIDLDAKTPTVYYFENEAFGKAASAGDIASQITRMVIAGDGKGYALTNDASQLIQFTTKKKAVITNLGPVTDDPSNGRFAIGQAHGGDMVADDDGNLYVITANRRVYRVNIETRVALYLGSIKGLPEGYTTNGAAVEGGDAIIVNSSNTTKGFYRFSLSNLQAEKISSAGTVLNASDLANGNLVELKKKKEEKTEQLVENKAPQSPAAPAIQQTVRNARYAGAALSVFPNPVSGNTTSLSLSSYPEGRYEAQLIDLEGRQLNRQIVQLNAKSQVVSFRLPSGIAKGSYFIRLVDDEGLMAGIEKIVVQ